MKLWEYSDEVVELMEESRNKAGIGCLRFALCNDREGKYFSTPMIYKFHSIAGSSNLVSQMSTKIFVVLCYDFDTCALKKIISVFPLSFLFH